MRREDKIREGKGREGTEREEKEWSGRGGRREKRREEN